MLEPGRPATYISDGGQYMDAGILEKR